MQLTGLTIVAAAVFAFALVSGLLAGTPLILPIIFAGFGWLIGAGGLDIAPIDPGHGTIHTIAELTLILVLFSDAARIDLSALLKDHALPARLLGIGMPLTVLAGIGFAFLVFPNATFGVAFLVAAILTPTDAALGQAVVSDKVVPVRIRQALNVESGLNDGLALPLVLVAVAIAGATTGVSNGAGSLSGILVSAGLQIVLGPVAGLAIGYFGTRLIDISSGRRWMTGPFQGIAVLSVALLAYWGAELIGGNGFIAAFAAGLMFGANIKNHCDYLFEFMESEGQLLTLLVFLVFGAAMLPDALAHANWGTVILALGFLTIVRMVPVAIALVGTGLSVQSTLFLGWFGPRGIASILFALLIVEGRTIPGGGEVLACVMVAVALSIVLHGASAGPLSRLYGAFVARRGECAEIEPVSEMRLRHQKPGGD
ncbi:MAG: cation:proton antiporter [Alphaproteobacteria bacterium]